MRKTTFISLVLTLLMLCRPSIAQTSFQDLPLEFRQKGYPQLVEECKDVLKAAYMAQNKLGTYYDIPNWEGYPVELWEYYTGEDIKKHVKKRGLVYLLMPTPEKLATWIATTCWEVKQSVDTCYTNCIRDFIKWQTAAQFAVAGVVYEDMYTKGFYEPYIFKDGVTVYVADSTKMPADKHCTDEQLEYYLRLTNDDLKPNTGRYARICSTNRDHYYAAGGTIDVGDNENNRKHTWLEVVRQLYQQAWNSDRNELMIAWAKSSPYMIGNNNLTSNQNNNLMTNNAITQPSEKKSTKSLLLLVDVQYDFINGSLAVNGAPAVMENLANYIAEQPEGTFDNIVMTADFHPYDHSSFKDNGGLWPVHCVQYTHGSSIYQPVFDAVMKQFPKAQVLTKGDDIAVDEYSIMANKSSAKKLLNIIEENSIEEIYVAGLCGDYCVGNSIKDLVKAGHGSKIRVLTRFIGNIDDGTTLRNIITENNLLEK